MQMANITVKAANGTTDVVYTQLGASAGDDVPARWRVEDTSPIAYRRRANMLTRDNAKRNARVAIFTSAHPVIRQVNGVDTLIGTIPLQTQGTMGTNFTQAEIDEAVAQHMNLCASALVSGSFKAGYSPT